MARVRLGFAFEERARTRLAQLADKAGLSHNAALEALVVGASDQDTLKAIELGTEVLRADKTNRLDLNRELSYLTDEQRAALIAAVKETK
jgi:predicted DNA binding protein